MVTRHVQGESPLPNNEPWPGPRLVVHDEDDAQRAEVEAFIGRVYARRFGAQVRAFAPTLVSLRDPLDGSILAAAGYRSARQMPLFLERYLDEPVESLLAAQAGAPLPSRDGIFEVGHLAADRSGEGRRLIFLLGPHLAAEGAQWVVSTLTEELRHLFVRLGIAPLALSGDAFAHWPLLAKGIANGTDPAHPDYWGDVRQKDQRLVELAALGFALRLAPQHLWEPLSDAQKDNVRRYLLTARERNYADNNWKFFRVMVDMALAAGVVDLEGLRRTLE